jgi:hypothetical protein
LSPRGHAAFGRRRHHGRHVAEDREKNHTRADRLTQVEQPAHKRADGFVVINVALAGFEPDQANEECAKRPEEDRQYPQTSASFAAGDGLSRVHFERFNDLQRHSRVFATPEAAGAFRACGHAELAVVEGESVQATSASFSVRLRAVHPPIFKSAPDG